MKNLKPLAFSLLFINSVFAQPVTSPSLHEGDKWIYNVTEEINISGVMQSSNKKWINTVSRVGSKSFSLSSKPLDSNLPPKEFFRNLDWSSETNMAGSTTLVSRPYSFPMQPGKTWDIEYTENNLNERIKLAKTKKEYTVINWEQITVPAGKFKALKIEMNGKWFNEFNTIAPSASALASNNQNGSISIAKTTKEIAPQPTTGNLYQAIWYVPELNSYAKIIIEDYRSDGQLNKRHIEELDSF
jgi:hypothetical protein